MSDASSLPIAVGALTSAIAQNLNTTELTILSAFFSQLGDSLALIAAVQSSESASDPASCSGSAASNS